MLEPFPKSPPPCTHNWVHPTHPQNFRRQLLPTEAPLRRVGLHVIQSLLQISRTIAGKRKIIMLRCSCFSLQFLSWQSAFVSSESEETAKYHFSPRYKREWELYFQKSLQFLGKGKEKRKRRDCCHLSRWIIFFNGLFVNSDPKRYVHIFGDIRNTHTDTVSCSPFRTQQQMLGVGTSWEREGKNIHKTLL